jgi:hypothetical protein
VMEDWKTWAAWLGAASIMVMLVRYQGRFSAAGTEVGIAWEVGASLVWGWGMARASPMRRVVTRVDSSIVDCEMLPILMIDEVEEMEMVERGELRRRDEGLRFESNCLYNDKDGDENGKSDVIGHPRANEAAIRFEIIKEANNDKADQIVITVIEDILLETVNKETRSIHL